MIGSAVVEEGERYGTQEHSGIKAKAGQTTGDKIECVFSIQSKSSRYCAIVKISRHSREL